LAFATSVIPLLNSFRGRYRGQSRATAAGACLRRAREAGIAWPLAEEMTDALEARLYPASAALAQLASLRPQPDWAANHRELKRPGVTLQLQLYTTADFMILHRFGEAVTPESYCEDRRSGPAATFP
jgi:hypothetical protein